MNLKKLFNETLRYTENREKTLSYLKRVSKATERPIKDLASIWHDACMISKEEGKKSDWDHTQGLFKSMAGINDNISEEMLKEGEFLKPKTNMDDRTAKYILDRYTQLGCIARNSGEELSLKEIFKKKDLSIIPEEVWRHKTVRSTTILWKYQSSGNERWCAEDWIPYGPDGLWTDTYIFNRVPSKEEVGEVIILHKFEVDLSLRKISPLLYCDYCDMPFHWLDTPGDIKNKMKNLYSNSPDCKNCKSTTPENKKLLGEENGGAAVSAGDVSGEESETLLNEDRVEPVIAYHGTSDIFLREILKKGIIPNPKKRTWTDDPQSQESGGISKASIIGSSYWTTNLMTAIGSGRRTERKFKNMYSGGKAVIIVANIIPESGFTDEDNVQDYFENILNSVLKKFGIYNISKDSSSIAKFWGMIDAKKKELLPIIKEVAVLCHNIFTKNKAKPVPYKLFLKWVISFIKYKTFFAKNDYYYKQEYLRYYSHYASGKKIEYDKIPDPKEKNKNFTLQQLTDNYQKIQDSITKYYKEMTSEMRKQDAFSATMRISAPVAYKGRNRIICIVKETNSSDREYGTDMGLIYGEIPQKLFKDWKEKISSDSKVIDLRKEKVQEMDGAAVSAGDVSGQAPEHIIGKPVRPDKPDEDEEQGINAIKEKESTDREYRK